MREWTRTEKLNFYAVIVAIVGVCVALLTVPEVRRFLGLTDRTPTTLQSTPDSTSLRESPPKTPLQSTSNAPQITPASSATTELPQVPVKQATKIEPFNKRVEVPANEMWFDTGIDVTGKTVRIEYEAGRWSNGGDQPLFADGRGANSWNGLIVPDAPLRSLVGKTSNRTFFVGNLYEGSIGQGKLYLSIK